MPDYNIYIKTNATSTNKTDPASFDDSNTTPSEDSQSSKESFKALAKSGAFSSSSLRALGTAGIIALGAYEAVKQVDRAITMVEPFISQQTGDYRFNIGYNNIKKTISALTHPTSTILARLHANQNYHLAEMKKEQERQLLGDSIINNFGDYEL